MKKIMTIVFLCISLAEISAQTNQEMPSDSVKINQEKKSDLSVNSVKKSVTVEIVKPNLNTQNVEYPRDSNPVFLNPGKQNNAVNPKDYMIRGALNLFPKVKIKL